MGQKITTLPALVGNIKDTDLFELSKDAGSGTYQSNKVTFQQLKSGISAGITVGTTPVTSGTDGRVFFQAGGVTQQDAGFLWDTTNKRMQLLGTGVIASPALNSVLEIKAKNGLSDIAFRVRNSADSYDLFSIQGDGGIVGRMVAHTQFWQMSSASGVYRWEIGFAGNLPFIAVGGQDGSARFAHKAVSDNREFACGVAGARANFALGGIFSQGTVKPNEANNNTLYVFNGTAPALNATDAFQLYSADITAGNAAPHIRTEAGDIIKLYKETTGVGAATLVGNAGTNITDTDTFDGYTLKQIVKALRNQGLLA